MPGSQTTFSPSCSRCALQNVCFVNGLHAKDLNKLDLLVDRKPSFAKGDHLFKAGQEMTSLYAIRSGLVKVYSMQNGEEVIHDFYLSGDIVGLDGMADKVHLFNAKVVEDAHVCSVSFEQLNHLGEEIPNLNLQVLKLMSQEIVKERNHATLLTHKTAEEKIADFLVNMMEKYRSRGYEYMQFRLAVLHRDVANFLNLTPETVSRILAKFNQEDVVTWKKKEVIVKDIEKLFQYARIPLPEVLDEDKLAKIS